jgi:hypothetical protein
MALNETIRHSYYRFFAIQHFGIIDAVVLLKTAVIRTYNIIILFL